MLGDIQEATGQIPLVLHGGSGIPEDQIKRAISLGVAKINVNTELQVNFAEETRKYIEAEKIKKVKDLILVNFLHQVKKELKLALKKN